MFVIIFELYVFFAQGLAITIITEIRETEIRISNDLIFFIVIFSLPSICFFVVAFYSLGISRLLREYPPLRTSAIIALLALAPVLAYHCHAGISSASWSTIIFDLVTLASVSSPLVKGI